MTESQLQSQIIKSMKARGCFVVKLQSGPGVPIGAPDVLVLMPGGGWAALEVKGSEKAKFQPFQKETIERLNGMWYARVVHPTNWEQVKKELLSFL